MSEMPRITRNEATRTLEVVIDERERDENTARLLKALTQEEELKATLAARRADINASLKAVRKTIKDMRESLDRGKELRDVQCEEVWNFQYEAVVVEALGVTVPPNSVSVIRLDTKEVVGAPRPIRDEERQRSFLGKANNPMPADDEKTTGAETFAPNECRRLDLRATHCGLCADDGCTQCCRVCPQHLDTMSVDQPEGCDRDLVADEDDPSPLADDQEVAEPAQV